MKIPIANSGRDLFLLHGVLEGKVAVGWFAGHIVRDEYSAVHLGLVRHFVLSG